ncbi:MAG TPA: hypothetical protein VNN80_29155, partial [Polyangiaceae bacterium]|nr:hypothetical protein [Polyangiaceae bacterium]
PTPAAGPNGLPGAAGCIPSGEEICDDEMRDEDCDGVGNEGCGCMEGQTASCAQAFGSRGACATERATCTGGQWQGVACTTNTPEQCDTAFADEDCDGAANEAPPCQTLTTIETSQGHACGISTSGRVLCWGNNNWGELGNGLIFQPSTTPVEVPGVTGAQSLAVADEMSCAVLSDRSARCWGRMPINPYGAGSPNAGPTLVTVFPEVLQLAIDRVRLCAVLPDQTISCTYGNAPNVTPARVMSTPMFGPTGVQALARGGGDSFSAIVADRTVHRWRDDETESVALPGLTDAVELGDGAMACARLATGQVGCWGESFTLPAGQLSALVPGIDNAVALSTGDTRACAVRADGTVACWGSDLSPVPMALNKPGVAEIRVQTNQSFIVRFESGEIFSATSGSVFALQQLFIP